MTKPTAEELAQALVELMANEEPGDLSSVEMIHLCNCKKVAEQLLERFWPDAPDQQLADLERQKSGRWL